MEYFKLGTLQDLYNKKKTKSKTMTLKEPIVRQVVIQLVEALAYCLTKGIVHRDIKPANIVIRRNTAKVCNIVLIDFGEAKYFYGNDGFYDLDRDGDIKEHQMKGAKGTPMTAAPEVSKGEVYNYKCDCWSVGVVAYFLLCGNYPWEGENAAEIAIAVKTVVWDFKPVTVSKRFGENVKRFIVRQIEAKPEKRMSYTQMLGHNWLNVPKDQHHLVEPQKGQLQRTCKEELRKSCARLYSCIVALS